MEQHPIKSIKYRYVIFKLKTMHSYPNRLPVFTLTVAMYSGLMPDKEINKYFSGGADCDSR